MALDRAALEALGREPLIQEARRFGVRRPEVMTRVELIDEVLRLGTPNPTERKKVRGWLGVARDLVADIVEQGLNLPDAAALIRGDFKFEPLKPIQPPVATVTLAEIYGAQGHFQKALAMLDEVLGKEPDHEAARKLRDRLERERGTAARPAPPVPEAAAVAPEEPEPPTPRQPLEELPAFATAHIPPPDEEPLTPRRLSKQPPPDAPTIAEYDSEPLTPRRLSKPPAAEPKEIGPTELASEAAPVVEEKRAELARPEQSEGAQGVRGISSGEDYGEGGRAGMKQNPGMVQDPGMKQDPEEVTQNRAGLYEAEALLIRKTPTTAVVYFELGGNHVNGDPAIVQVIEWRPSAAGVERVTHDVPVSGSRGTVVVEGLLPGAIVRGAVGHRRHGRFKPVAVCGEATLEAGAATVVWSPRARKDYGPVAGRAASYVAL